MIALLRHHVKANDETLNYANAVKAFLETKTLSDSKRAMLMGGACTKAYGWSPKK